MLSSANNPPEATLPAITLKSCSMTAASRTRRAQTQQLGDESEDDSRARGVEDSSGSGAKNDHYRDHSSGSTGQSSGSKAAEIARRVLSDLNDLLDEELDADGEFSGSDDDNENDGQTGVSLEELSLAIDTAIYRYRPTNLAHKSRSIARYDSIEPSRTRIEDSLPSRLPDEVAQSIAQFQRILQDKVEHFHQHTESVADSPFGSPQSSHSTCSCQKGQHQHGVKERDLSRSWVSSQPSANEYRPPLSPSDDGFGDRDSSKEHIPPVKISTHDQQQQTAILCTRDQMTTTSKVVEPVQDHFMSTMESLQLAPSHVEDPRSVDEWTNTTPQQYRRRSKQSDAFSYPQSLPPSWPPSHSSSNGASVSSSNKYNTSRQPKSTESASDSVDRSKEGTPSSPPERQHEVYVLLAPVDAVAANR